MATSTRIALKHLAAALVALIPIAFVVMNWVDSIALQIGASVTPFVTAICTAAGEAYSQGASQASKEGRKDLTTTANQSSDRMSGQYAHF